MEVVKQSYHLNSKRVAVIVPAYNEELSIRRVLEDLHFNNPGNWEIIVVNDHSTDNTLKEARKLADSVIELPINLGIGGCVQSGLLYAMRQGHDIAVQFDSDGQHLAKEISILLDCLNESDVDVVIGSRFIDNFSGQYKSSFYRRLGIRVISAFTLLITGQKVKDPTSGFRAFNKNAIKLFANQYPVHYPEPESFILLYKNWMKFKEVATLMHPRMAGKSSIKRKAFFYMFNVLLGMAVTALRPAEKYNSGLSETEPSTHIRARNRATELKNQVVRSETMPSPPEQEQSLVTETTNISKDAV